VKPSREALALAAAAATGVLVGAAMVATRYVVNDIGPLSLGLLRYAIALLCLAPFVAFHRRVHFARQDLLAIVGLGIIQFAVLIILINLGLRSVTSTRAALLFATMPLLTMVVAAAVGSERLSMPKTVGALLTFAGVAATLGENLLAGSGRGEWVGIGMVLTAALCGAACSVFYRPYLARYPTLPLATVAMVASVLFLALLAQYENFFTHRPSLDAKGWAAVVFIGISSGSGYMLLLWALKHASPTRVTVFLSLSPVTAAWMGVAFLGESITPGIVLGMLGVAGGLWAATR
jgi:drug/metabolite transporter (DMT)-like permease